MAKHVKVTGMVYIQPPWTRTHLIITRGEYCVHEKQLWTARFRAVQDWENSWKEYDRQPQHDFVAVGLMPPPPPFPPYYHGDELTPVNEIVID